MEFFTLFNSINYSRENDYQGGIALFTVTLKESSLVKSSIFYYVLLVSIIAIFLVGEEAQAAPAAPIKSAYTQPDGIVFYAEQHGDEVFNWKTAADGAVITQSLSGYWTYAVIEGNHLVAGPVNYAIQPPPADFITSMDVLPLYQQRSELKKSKSSASGDQHGYKSPIYRNGEVKTNVNLSSPQPLVVLLVEFNDVKVTTTESSWHERIFGATGKTVNSYYKESSNQQFYFTPANEIGENDDGVIKISLNQNHPNTAGDGDLTHLNRLLAKDALIAADSHVDFASYDANGDSSISRDELHIMTIIAGQEEAYSNLGNLPSVWGHFSALEASDAPTLDGMSVLNGVKNGSYTQFGEKHGAHQATIGIIVHELGHDLDLPDLYDVDPSNDDTYGVGGFSVMGSGSWAFLDGEEAGETPVHFDAWSKAFLGFESPIVIPYGSDLTATVNALDIRSPSGLNQYNIYKVQTQDPDEYFLLENRQQGVNSGFDQGLSLFTNSSGIAIWHIDSSVIRYHYGSVNDLFPKGVDLESFDLAPGDPFYHDGFLFDRYSTPSSSYNDALPKSDFIDPTLSLISIYTDSPSSIGMKVSMGVSPILLEMPAFTSSDDSFTYSTEWNEAVDIYYVILPQGAESPLFSQVVLGNDHDDNPVALSGHLAIAKESPGELIRNGLLASTNYDLYMVSSDKAGHRGDSQFFAFSTLASTETALMVGSLQINEGASNDGSLTSTQTLTVTNATYGGFATDLTTLDVTVNHLPEGLNYSVERTSDSVLTIAFTGHAAAHANADDVRNVSFTVAKNKIPGAAGLLTSNPFAINFKDPSKIEVISDTIYEAYSDGGTITDIQIVTLTNGQFAENIANADVKVTNLPAGLDYNVTRESDSELTLSFIGQATNHASTDDASNLSVTIAQSSIRGATEDLTSNEFAIDFQDLEPELIVGSATIEEAAANDGSITATQTVTVTNATYVGFDPSISKPDVTINHLPEGLEYTVTRTSETVLTIGFTGAATNHANVNDVSNVSITIARDKIAGATDHLTSNLFTINFNDPASTQPPPPPAIYYPTTPPTNSEVIDNGDEGVSLGRLKSEAGKDGNGKAIEMWKIDSDLLQKAMDSLVDKRGAAKRIAIPISLTADKAASVELPADALAQASSELQDAIISITADNASYNLPLRAIDLQTIAQRLGSNLKDMKVNITLSLVTGEAGNELAQSARAAGLNLLGTAIEFDVTVTGNGKSHQVTDYGSTYVSRMIVLNQSVIGLTPSVVAYEPMTGKISFVPATFSVVNGKTFVTIKRNGNSIYSVVEADKTFEDIQSHWARSDIELLASKALIKGISESAFAPDQMITRVQFAALLVQALGLREEHAAAKFSDLMGTEWYAGYVGAAVKANLVSGFSDGTFRPNEQITREQMAVMVTNAVRFTGVGFSEKASSQQLLAGFKDRTEISQWAEEAVAQVLEAGIMSGVNSDEFSPADFATRSQAASIVKRLLVHLRFID